MPTLNARTAEELAGDLNRSLRALLTTGLRRRKLDYEKVKAIVQEAGETRGDVALANGVLVRFFEQAGAVKRPPSTPDG
jgi:hypothetical protein